MGTEVGISYNFHMAGNTIFLSFDLFPHHLKVLKTLLEKTWGKTSWYCSWQWFLGHDTESRGNKRKKIDKWDYVKLKTFCVSKDKINSKKEAYGMGENICKSSDKGLICK